MLNFDNFTTKLRDYVYICALASSFKFLLIVVYMT